MNEDWNGGVMYISKHHSWGEKEEGEEEGVMRRIGEFLERSTKRKGTFLYVKMKCPCTGHDENKGSSRREWQLKQYSLRYVER